MSWNLNLQLNQLYKVVKTLQTTALTNPLVSSLNFANNSITSCNNVACVSVTATGASTIPTISNSLTCSSNIIQSDGSGTNYLQTGKIVPQRNLFIINTPKTYAIPISSVSYNGTTTYITYTTPLTDLYSIPPGGGSVTVSGTNVPAANTTFTLNASGAQTLYAQINGNPAGLINPTNSSAGTLTWTYSGSAGITFQSDSVAYATFTTASLTLTGDLNATNLNTTSTTGKLTVNTARLWTGAGNLGGNIILGGTTAGDNLTGGGSNGKNNTVMGTGAGNALSSGYINVLMGQNSGTNMTSGIGNVGLGAGALGASTTGSNNTAFGRDALGGVMTGDQNIGIGFNTGVVTSGANNTLIGQAVARSLTTGSGNICMGYDVGNTAPLLTTGSYNVYIGYGANASGTNAQAEIVLGQGLGKGNNTFFVASTGGSQQGNGSTLWGIPSDIRIKTNIAPLESSLSKILALEPVSYEHKEDIHNNIIKKRSGYLAQDYEKIFPEHCGTCVPNKFEREELGLEEVKNLCPDFMPHMIKAFQEQHQIVQKQQDEINSLKDNLESLRNQVNALTKLIIKE